MDVYQRGIIKVRTVKEKDRINILKLISTEDFGCSDTNQSFRPTVLSVNHSLTKIINKEIDFSEILVIEKADNFIGYAFLSKDNEFNYYLNQIAISHRYRRCGYCTILLDVIKDLAKQDNNSTIRLKCTSYNGDKFFDKMGINNKNNTSNYPNLDREFKTDNYKSKKILPNIFPNNSKIKFELEIINEEENMQKQYVKSKIK